MDPNKKGWELKEERIEGHSKVEVYVNSKGEERTEIIGEFNDRGGYDHDVFHSRDGQTTHDYQGLGGGSSSHNPGDRIETTDFPAFQGNDVSADTGNND